jgi:hypothetical protein
MRIVVQYLDKMMGDRFAPKAYKHLTMLEVTQLDCGD